MSDFSTTVRRALLVLAIAIGAAAADARPPLRLKIYALPDPRNTHIHNQAQLAVIEAFHRRYPNVRLTGHTGVNIEGLAISSKTLMSIAGGQAPDVLFVSGYMSETYISQGFLSPLDKYVKQVPEEELRSRIFPSQFPIVRRAGPDGKVHWWAIPFQTSIRTLLYRKDFFQQVGLDVDRPPRDWAELERFARRLTQPEKGRCGIYFRASGGGGAWDWAGLLYANGGDVVAQTPTGEWRAVFDDDKAVEALFYYVRLLTRKWPDASGKMIGPCAYNGPGAYERWCQGRMAMALHNISSSTPGTSDPEITGFGIVPLGPSGGRGAQLSTIACGVFSDIQPRDGYSAEEIREAAWNYVWFRDSKEARRIHTRRLVEGGYAKLVNPLYLKEFGYDEYVKLFPKECLAAYEEAMSYGKPEPYGKNCHRVYNYISKAVDQCMALEKRGQLGATDDERRERIGAILRETVQRTNTEMLGIISPEERRKRNNVALVVGICLVAVFAFVVYRVWRIFTPEEALQKGGWQFRKYAWAYVFMLPAVLSILLWRYCPMIMGSAMAFLDYRVVGESRFVGLQNLADVLWDPVWWKSLGRTAYYMTLMLGLGFWTPIALAILLSEVSRGKVAYRVLFYLPAVLSGMVVIYLWKILYDPSQSGVLNMVLGALGIPPLGWITDERMAMFCCVLPMVWAGAGPGCLVYLAALKTVPDDLYEAASLDGCGFFSKIRHITLPTIKGLIIIQFIGAFIASAQSTGIILVMTFGGPNEATKVANLHIFEKSYLMLRFGTAVTMAWLLGVALLCFTTLQLKRLSRMEFRTAGRL